MTAPAAIDAFEAHRRHLMGLAYRMLGSLAEAEDVVQEAYLRWHGADRADVENPRAFLSKIVTRLCLDQLKSARRRHETYVGPWLPEPVLDDGPLAAETAGEYAHDLSVALLLVLERLSPLERAAFLLHDVFDMEFAEIAQALGRGEAACRQLAARARQHVHEARPRFAASSAEGARLAEAFRLAASSGDAAALARLLAKDATLYTDGGGKRLAALNPIFGSDKIIRFLVGIAKKGDAAAWHFRSAEINGAPGFVLAAPDGTVQTVSFDISAGRIAAVYMVLNPDKLQRVAF
ncbi:MAG TPA: sigma-70 family RNA polymerase sigma factor [Stellaceae bacterium]|nr:sigma-70 family RNA polymerase sigma factor [Stellaceae bacterium]